MTMKKRKILMISSVPEFRRQLQNGDQRNIKKKVLNLQKMETLLKQSPNLDMLSLPHRNVHHVIIIELRHFA
jgi:hypothetical protein